MNSHASPGPVYHMENQYSCGTGTNRAPKINIVSFDRAEHLIPHDSTPSPQHYNPRPDIKKRIGPIIGFDRFSLKQKVTN